MVLPTPTYSKFKPMNPLYEHYDFSTCQLVKDMLLSPIDLSDKSAFGHRIALSAQGGNFLIQQMFNSPLFYLIDTPEAITSVFGTVQPGSINAPLLQPTISYFRA